PGGGRLLRAEAAEGGVWTQGWEERDRADPERAGADAPQTQETREAEGSAGGEGAVSSPDAAADGHGVSLGHRALLATDGGLGAAALPVYDPGYEERGGLLGVWVRAERHVRFPADSTGVHAPGSPGCGAQLGAGANGPGPGVQWRAAQAAWLRLRAHGASGLRRQPHVHAAALAERERGGGGLPPVDRGGVLRPGELHERRGLPAKSHDLPARF